MKNNPLKKKKKKKKNNHNNNDYNKTKNKNCHLPVWTRENVKRFYSFVLNQWKTKENTRIFIHKYKYILLW